MRWLKAALSSLVMGFSASAFSFDFNSNYYAVYETGHIAYGCVHVYIVPKPSLLIIASDVPTPIMFVPQTTGFKANLCSDGSLSGFEKVNLTAADMPLVGATLSPLKLFGGDFDGDGKQDFLLQGNDTVRNSVVLTADVTGTPQIYYNFYGALSSAQYSQITTADTNRDGRTDIIATDIYGNKISIDGTWLAAGSASQANQTFNVNLVGSIDGKFDVDELGVANYRLNILSAAGTAGVAPQISLNYSSSGGDGVAGTGWSIGGISAITRCRQTLAQDNKATAISLGAEDRFCLDGQRLILTSGTYGADGSKYRTEIDSYAVVTAINGGTTGNPKGFSVVRKDGSTSYYGAYYLGLGADAQHVISGKVLNWSISRFQDSVGNAIRFSYFNSVYTNEHLISRIDYAYGSDPGTVNSSPTNTYLQFNYHHPRPDVSSGYIAGSQISRTLRLTSIRSYSGGIELRNYNLVYRAPDGIHAQSFVEKLFECVGASCLPPTQFTWSLNQPGFSTGSLAVSLAGNAAGSVLPIEVNGDGKTDIVYVQPTAQGITLGYALANSNGYNAGVSLGLGIVGSADISNLHVVDYNNDGFQDLMVGKANGNWKVYFGAVSGLSNVSLDTGIAYTPNAQIIDLNGDGLPDLTYLVNGGWRYRPMKRVASGSGWSHQFDAEVVVTLNITKPTIPSIGPLPEGVNRSYTYDDPVVLPNIVDFNGDGVPDLAVGIMSTIVTSFYLDSTVTTYDTMRGFWVAPFYAAGNGVFTQGAWRHLNFLSTACAQAGPCNSNPLGYFYAKLTAGDINGDGLPDLCAGACLLNTGNQSFSAAQLNGSTYAPYLDSDLVDYNGDGYLDFIYSLNGGLSVRLYDPVAKDFSTSAVALGISYDTAAKDQYLRFDANGEGHVDIVRTHFNGSATDVYIHRSNSDSLVTGHITRIDNGLGYATDITFKPLTDSSVYSRETDANNIAWALPSDIQTLGKPYPVSDIVAPYYVVSKVTNTGSTALSGANTSVIDKTSYFYSGAKWESSSRGFLGFHTVTTNSHVDSSYQTTSVATYRQDFPFIGQPLSITLKSAAGVTVKSTQTQGAFVTQAGYGTTKYYQVYTAKIDEFTNDPISGDETSYVVTQTAQPDVWGNVTSAGFYPGILTTIYDSTDAIVTQTLIYNTLGSTDYEKQFGRLSSTTLIYARPGLDNITRTSSFTYFPSGTSLQGLLKTEVVNTADGAPTQTTTYEYDVFGNKNKVVHSATGLDNRYVSTTYDWSGRYVSSSASAFNTSGGWVDQVTESVVARNTYGQPTQVNGVNGLVANYSYDPLGRESSRSNNTGTGLVTAYALGGIAGAQYQVATTANTGSQTIRYIDALGRNISERQLGFDGRWISSETEYDNLGRVKRQSVPHYNGDTTYWTTNNYDSFRLTSQVAPASNGTTATTSFAYGVYYVPFTTITNALGQARTEARNSAGELIKVTDHQDLGGVVSYTYDAAGQLIGTTNTGFRVDPTTQVSNFITTGTSLTYDGLGRKIKMIDSDKGIWFYKYNGFGDLIDQYKIMSSAVYPYLGDLDAAKADSSVLMQRVHMDYDRRGRMIARADYREGNVLEGAATWTYDTAANGVGQLAQESGGGLVRTLSYDTRGRLTSTLQNAGDGGYIQSVSFDGYGRPYQQTDALGSGSGTQNSYNGYGYLQSVTDLATSTVLYQVNNMDARGNVTTALLGNGGNSTWNYDAGSGLLLSQTGVVGATTLQNLTYTWDVLGNQTSRWDRGLLNAPSTYKNLQQSFCHDGLNRLLKTNQGTLTVSCPSTAAQQDLEYDSFGSITRKTGVGIYEYSNGHPHQLSSTSDGITNTYDNVGNMTSDSSGRVLHYTVYDKPDSISKGTAVITFAYGPDRLLTKRVDTDASGTSTSYTIGAVEKVIKPDGSYDMKRSLAGGGLWTHHFNSSGVQTSLDKQYLYTDILGSVVLITDHLGAVKQQFAFDAWGRRVWANNWSTVLAASGFLPVANQRTTDGFTGHEMLDSVGLIHMQGRIYDQRLGRFVQADPYVQRPDNLQQFNRYSYVLNSPLSHSDPTGYATHPDTPRGGCSIACVNISGGYNGGGKWKISGSASYNQPVDSHFSMAPVDWSPFEQGQNSFNQQDFSGAMGDPHFAATQSLVSSMSLVSQTMSAGTYSSLTGGKFRSGGISSFDPTPTGSSMDDDGNVTIVADRIYPTLYGSIEDRDKYYRQELSELGNLYLSINMNNPLFAPEAIVMKGVLKVGVIGVGAVKAARGEGSFTKVLFEKGATRNSPTQIRTELSPEQAIKNLEGNGFIKKSFEAQNGGTGHLLTNGEGKVYRFYPNSTSGTGDSAAVINRGIETSKLRLNEGL